MAASGSDELADSLNRFWNHRIDIAVENVATLMKAGANAVLTARSSRGTQTQDTFSLLGFTAAVEEAENRCTS